MRVLEVQIEKVCFGQGRPYFSREMSCQIQSKRQKQASKMSLFGGPQQQSNFGGGGGLFGQQPQQQQQPSLFGGGQQQPQGQAPPGGNLFGGAPQQQQQPQGGLFGGQSQAPPGGAPGGLFGQPTNPQSSTGAPGGLFGGQSQSAFGQPQQQPQGAFTSQGGIFGGQPQQQPGGAFSQGLQGTGQQQPGGLFGNKPPGAPGQTSTFGTGGFNSLAATSQSAFTGQQQSSTPAFGATTSTSAFAGGSGGTSAFGGTGGGSSLFAGAQPQQQQSSLFGGQQNQQKPGGLFGQPAQSTPTSAFGGASQSAFGGGLGGGSSLFGQPQGQTQQSSLMTQPSFGGQPGQQSSLFSGQPQQPGGLGQPGLGGTQLGMGQQQPGGMGGQFPPGSIYADNNEYQQSITTVNVPYNELAATAQVSDNKVKEPMNNLIFHSLRGQNQFKAPSAEMLRLVDYMAQKGQQQQSYEFLAMQQFRQNPQQYPLLEMSRQRAAQNQPQPQGNTFQQTQSQFSQSAFGGQQQSTGLFNNQSLQQQPQQIQGGFNSFNKPPMAGQQTPGLFSQSSVPQGQPTASTGMWGQPAGGATQSAGLFNQTPGQTSSLFSGAGAQQPQQQTQQSSLFNSQGGFKPPGQQQQTSSLFNQPTGGLFPNGQQPQQTGALFGPKPTAQPQQPGASGLFSQQSTTTPGGSGLFNNQPKPATSLFGPSAGQPQQPGATGLFNQPQQQQKPGGLFGPQTTQPSSLFNPAGQQQPAQNSLFGPQSTTVTQPGSLFGPSTQQPQQTGLFNQQPSTTPGQSLWGQPQAQPGAQPTPGQGGQGFFNPMSVYQSSDPFGINSGFMSKPPESVEQIKKELEAIQRSAENIKNVYDKDSKSVSDSLGGTSTSAPPQDTDVDSWTQPSRYNNYASSDIHLGVNLSSRQIEANEREEERMREKLQQKYGVGGQIHKSQSKALRESQTGSKSKVFNSASSFRDLSKRASYNTESLYRKSTFEKFEDTMLREPKGAKEDEVPNLSRIGSRVSQVSHNSSQAEHAKQEKRNKDTLAITMILNFDMLPPQELKVNIHKSRDVSDLWKRTISWLVEQFQFNEDQSDKVDLLFKNKTMSKKASLEEAGITEDAKVYVDIDQREEKKNKEERAEEVKPKEVEKTAAPPSQDQLPKPPKPGHEIHPPMDDLLKKSLEELKAVEELKIWNEFGSVEWIGKTDVTGVNFADIVTISKRNAEVYDEVRHKLTYPQVGEKLNKPAIIILKDIKMKPGQSIADKEHRLRESLKKNDKEAGAGDQERAEHISYDSERGIWEFKVPHFTRWGDEDDSDDEEEAQHHDEPAVNKREEVKALEAPIAPQPTVINTAFKAPFEQSIVSKARNDDSEMICTTSQQQPATKRMPIFQPLQTSQFGGLGSKRRIMESDSERESVIISVQTPRQQISEMKSFSQTLSKRNRAAQIEDKIREKDLAFAKVNPMTCQKPSDKETMEFLKTLGITKGFAKTSLVSGIPRPAFSPNGQIAFVSGKKIRIVATAPIEKPAVKPYSPADTILKHSQVGQNLDDQMEGMSIGQHDEEESNPAADHFNKDKLFKDSFFLNLLSKEIPKISFCPNEANQAPQLSKFLTAVAKEMAQDKSEKVRHEFAAVCMLNALFGNPNLNLVQLHHSYRGPKTITRDLQTFGDKDTDKEYSKIQVEKKRWNAVCEVLKFHCQLVFSESGQPIHGSSDEQVYARALQLLQIGDVKEAVRHLSKHKKSKLALFLTKSVNPSGTYLQTQLMGLLGQSRLSQGVQRICAHFTCDKPESLNLPWEQELLRSLLFTSSASQSLVDHIRQKENLLRFQSSGSLLQSMLRLFAKCRDADQGFEDFANDYLDRCSQRDYRIRWLSQLVLRHYLTREAGNRKIADQGLYGKIGMIDDCYFVQVSCQYTRQLLFQKDWNSAMIVATMLPTRYEVIRSKLMFEILCSQSTKLLHGGLEQGGAGGMTLLRKLGVPSVWVQTSIALCLQNLSLYERAIYAWQEAGNPNQAHKIWYNKILPLYMNRGSSVKLVKALQLGNKLTQAERKQLIEAQSICKRTPLVDKMIEELARSDKSIKDWNTKTGNFKKFVEMLKVLATQGALTGDACREYKNVIRSIQGFSRDDDQDDIVDHFIAQEIATISNLLQVIEDDANVVEGKSQHFGVSYFQGSDNQFRLQSDEKFVAMNRPRIAREAEQLLVSQLLNRVAKQ